MSIYSVRFGLRLAITGLAITGLAIPGLAIPGLAIVFGAFGVGPALAQETYETWPLLRSTFPSTGGNGITIKGYDPVITGSKCVTTFMAVGSEPEPKVYPSYIEFDAVPAQGGTLCQNGKWRAFEGGASGTTPYRVFFKDGVFRGSP